MCAPHTSMAGQNLSSHLGVHAEALGSSEVLRRVVLVRSAQSIDRLPEALRNSNVIKMTVAEAKGLEFDDVFLLDFFNDSPAEWRNLNNFVADLEEIEELQGWKKLPAGSPLVDVRIKPCYIACAASVQKHDTQSCRYCFAYDTLWILPLQTLQCHCMWFKDRQSRCTEDLTANSLTCLTHRRFR